MKLCLRIYVESLFFLRINMKTLLVLCFLPCLLASNSLPVLYSPTCLSIPSISYNSLAILPGSQIQQYSSIKSGNMVLYKHGPLIRSTFTQSPSLRNASFIDTLPAKVPQICMKEQISSYPELEYINSAFVLAIELGDVNYIKEGSLAVRYTLNEILGRYLELENKKSDEVCKNEDKKRYPSDIVGKSYGVCERVERYYMNIWVGMCVIVSVVGWIMMDRGRYLFRDSSTNIEKEKSFMIELLESVEKDDRNIEEEIIEKWNKDIDRILLKVDTLLHNSESFSHTILSATSSLSQTVHCISASFKRSYSLPALYNTPNNQESPSDSIEFEPNPNYINEETTQEIEDRILTEKEDTSELDESFSSYEDLAEYSEEVEDSSLDFNSRVSREYDLARSLWGRSKKPGFMVSDV